MRNIKLTIEYDGTNYSGWQSQKNALSVQAVIESAIKELTGEDCRLTGAGRTDAGVHALGQVANFYTNSAIPAQRFSYALNGLLPRDIVVIASHEVDVDFHSRFSAVGKRYRYLVYNFPMPSALLRNRAYHVPFALDLKAMQEAAGYLIGKHDFAAFSASGSSVKTTVRTVTSASLEKSDRLITLDITGDGFLYNMVRIIMGTLVEVGLGKMEPGAVEEILESRDRGRAGATAPPHGLYLAEVYFRKEDMPAVLKK